MQLIQTTLTFARFLFSEKESRLTESSESEVLNKISKGQQLPIENAEFFIDFFSVANNSTKVVEVESAKEVDKYSQVDNGEQKFYFIQ